MWFTKKLHCNDIKFTLGCALFFTVLNALFIQRSWSIIAPAHLHDLLFAASVPLVLFCGWVIVFSLLNIPFVRKPLMIVLTLGMRRRNLVYVYLWHGYRSEHDCERVRN